jgi:plasmid maintenance system antidote protein VapI
MFSQLDEAVHDMASKTQSRTPMSIQDLYDMLENLIRSIKLFNQLAGAIDTLISRTQKEAEIALMVKENIQKAIQGFFGSGLLGLSGGLQMGAAAKSAMTSETAHGLQSKLDQLNELVSSPRGYNLTAEQHVLLQNKLAELPRQIAEASARANKLNSYSMAYQTNGQAMSGVANAAGELATGGTEVDKANAQKLQKVLDAQAEAWQRLLSDADQYFQKLLNDSAAAADMAHQTQVRLMS